MSAVNGEPISELLKSASEGAATNGGSEKNASTSDDAVDPLFKGASANEDLLKQASEFTKIGREKARERIAQVANERLKIAEEIGKDGLKNLDKFADLQQAGRKLAQNFVQEKVAEQQEQQKVAEFYDQIEEEHGKEAADDLSKFAFFDQVGRNLAAAAVVDAVENG